ncbi:MAG TPA: hypothetical protein VFM32_01230 [Spongiibacteraceae bacterium]|nr:hypothetical protein [Spongiibacteraceae bacterium]
MVDVRNINPIPVTQFDRAPKPASRAEPRDMPSTKLGSDAPKVERRRNPDRRRNRAKETFDRRLGADRRRNAVDIEV